MARSKEGALSNQCTVTVISDVLFVTQEDRPVTKGRQNAFAIFFRYWQILLQKSFCATDRNFSGP